MSEQVRETPLTTPASPPWAVASVITAMVMSAFGNGLLFAFIPASLAARGEPEWVAGAVLTAMSAGGLVGCFVTGLIVRRVGHARAYGAMAALVVVAALILQTDDRPAAWIAARSLYGVAVSGLFIIVQSWLNDACENAWRGRVISIFYTVYVLAIGLGGFALRWVDIDGPAAPGIAAACAALSIVPVSLTRLATPPPPAVVHVAFRSVWAISPVGLAGLFAVGGLTLLVQGFAPIYASAVGYGKDDIGLLMLLMQFGLLAVQLPLGTLSDRIDRRYVLVLTTVLVAIGGILVGNLDPSRFVAMVIIMGLWCGATETIYSVANAHANDRAEPQYYVSLATTLLVAWSASGVVLPAITTALTPVFGPATYAWVVMSVALAYGVFVALRIVRREPVAEDEQEPHQALSAQIPPSPELTPITPDDVEDEVLPEPEVIEEAQAS